MQTATPVGLYRGPGGADPGRLCIVDDGNGGLRFGIVHRDSAGRSCSGAGRAVSRAGVLRLEMAGDEACAIEASAQGLGLDFPAILGAGCSYYCAPGATMAGARFDKIGGTGEEAMQARDPVGDPLCPTAPSP